jgi:hypothetical protein
MPLRPPHDRLAVIGSSVAAVTGVLFGAALHPDYDGGLARSSPRQVLNPQVAASGSDVRLPFGLSVTVARPHSPVAAVMPAAAPVRRAAPPITLAEAAPQDEATVPTGPAGEEEDGASDGAAADEAPADGADNAESSDASSDAGPPADDPAAD